MSEKDRRVRTDPWSGVTYRLEAGEKAPPRPYLNDTCLRFLNLHGAFEDQRQPGSKAREHIDDCPRCRQYLARKEWERRKEEELLSSPDVEALVAEYAKRFRVPVYQRRKFIAAASVLALGALGLGAKAWFGGGGPRPVGNGGGPIPNVVHGIQQGFADLDRAYAEGGIASIDKLFTRGTTEEVLEAAHWAAESPKIPLIPTLVNALSDGRLEVRKGALAALMRMPPLSVKPFLSALNAAATNEPNPQFASILQGYAATIAQAR